MTDSDLHPYVEWIAREARRPVVVDPAARDRVMAAVRAEPVPRKQTSVWGRLVRPHAFHLSPVGGALLAAGLVGIGVLSGTFVNNRGGRSPVGYPTDTVASRHPVSSVDTVVKFVYLAPKADKVFLVGDFNGWDTTKTPLSRANDGSWSVTIPLASGRHLYGFVVDGSWSTDPHAPLAPDDGFGHANSVKLVRRGMSL
jgi:hypothetical protein